MSLPVINIGDTFIHPRPYNFNGDTFNHKYTILSEVHDVNTRFGKPDLLLVVQIDTVNADGSYRRTIDKSIKRWLSQLV